MSRTMLVRVTRSFNDCVIGDEAYVEYTDRVQGLINAGVFEVIGELDAEPEPVPEDDDTDAPAAPADDDG